VRKCNATLDLTRPCANDSMINSLIAINAGVKLNYYFINTLINPGN